MTRPREGPDHDPVDERMPSPRAPAVTRNTEKSLRCELNCGLTGMARQFSELSVILKGVAALPNSRS